MQLAPIVLFAYNRPFHLAHTLESLSNNTLAGESELIVYSDGPKNPSDKEELAVIEAVRAAVNKKKWCKSVTLVCAEKNKGLKSSIVEGVNDVISRHGRVIVIEDDLVLGKNFLSYMNEALEMYELKKRVMHISGYSFNMDKSTLGDTFFLPMTCSWGWATWSDRWMLFMNDAQKISDAINKRNEMNKFNFYGNYTDMQDQLEANIEGRLDTWGIKWYGSTFLQNGLSLYPKYSLVKNIGFDNSGMNSKEDKSFDVDLFEDASVQLLPLKVEESKAASQLFFSFLKEIQRRRTPWLPIRAYRYIKRKFLVV
ncbi:MAG: hypothetical protein ACKOXB_12535 [Flavobacteriales bacterium]